MNNTTPVTQLNPLHIIDFPSAKRAHELGKLVLVADGETAVELGTKADFETELYRARQPLHDAYFASGAMDGMPRPVFYLGGGAARSVLDVVRGLSAAEVDALLDASWSEIREELDATDDEVSA